MFLSIEASTAGWWTGVLQPMRSPGVVITLVLVGLLGGLAVRARRSSWALPAAFVVGLVLGGLIAVTLHRSLQVDASVIAVCVVLAVLLFVHPRRTGIIAPVAVVASGVVHGLAHSVDAAGDSHSLGYTAGFLFTTGMLLSAVDIVGASIGRSLRVRQAAEPGSLLALDDPALGLTQADRGRLITAAGAPPAATQR